MILAELKKYIFSKGSATRVELAKEFALSEDGVDAMLEMWVKKGMLTRMVDLDANKRVKRVRYRAVNKDDIQLTIYS